MDKLELSTDLVNAIMQYLGKQPFQEVAGIINGIQQQAFAQGAKPAEQAPAAPADAPAAQG
jgi:hypothetical protein